MIMKKARTIPRFFHVQVPSAQKVDVQAAAFHLSPDDAVTVGNRQVLSVDEGDAGLTFHRMIVADGPQIDPDGIRAAARSK